MGAAPSESHPRQPHYWSSPDTHQSSNSAGEWSTTKDKDPGELIITRWTCANCTTATSIAWRTEGP